MSAVNHSEEWRAIPGYEGAYVVSNTGRIRSLSRICIRGDGKRLTIKGRERRLFKVMGYSQVALCVDGASLHRKVHCLVAAAFIGPKKRGMQVNHKDGNKQNNHLDNLEYLTPSENVKHAFATGLTKPTPGETSVNAKLTDVRVRQILIERGITLQKDLAVRYGVAQSTIANIYRGTHWKHIPRSGILK